MQAFFQTIMYAGPMATTSRLRKLRLTAGLSVRELARLIGESHTNVSYWERTGKLPRADLLVPMSKALGVSVEEVLGEPPPKRAAVPGGKLGLVFGEVSKLPRRQQQKVIEMAEGFLALQRDDSRG